jgi:hypothetical protein
MESQACCILLPIVGFIAFLLGAMRASDHPCSDCSEVGGAKYGVDGVPRDATDPSKKLSPRSRTASPRPLPS